MKKTKTKSPRMKHVTSTTKTSCEPVARSILSIVVIFLTVAILLWRIDFNYRYYLVSGREVSMRDIARDMSTYFCDAYNISMGTRSDIFLLPGVAEVNQSRRTEVTGTLDQFKYDLDLYYLDYYLLEGSYIQVNACRNWQFSDVEGEIVLIKGDDSWDSWKSGSCELCPLVKKTISKTTLCSGDPVQIEYTVQNRDNFYIVLTKKMYKGKASRDYKAEVEISRTTFDVGHAQEKCLDSSACVLNLTYASDADVVLRFPEKSSFVSFTSKCHLRLSLWLGIFLALPVFLIFLIVCCYCCDVCNKKAKEEGFKHSHFQLGTLFRKGKSVVKDNKKYENLKSPPEFDTEEGAGTIQVV